METRHRAWGVLVSAGLLALGSCEAIGDSMRKSFAGGEGNGSTVDDSPPEDPVGAPARVETEELPGGATRLRLADFESVEVEQRTPVWCWAACAEMIHRYRGEEASQEDIAERVHGYTQDGELKVQMASRYEVYRALSPESAASPFDAIWGSLAEQLERAGEDLLEGDAGSLRVDWSEERAAQAAVDDLLPPTAVPIEELLEGRPAVAGLRRAPEATDGHLYVIVGATFRSSEARKRTRGAVEAAWRKVSPESAGLAERLGGDYAVEAVELVDPLRSDDPETPEDEMRVALPFEEFRRRVDFVATRADAREFFARWSEIAVVEAK